MPGSGFVPPMIVNCFVRHRLSLEYDRVAQGGREGFECVQAVQEGILCCGRFAGARYDCSFKWLICGLSFIFLDLISSFTICF